MTASRSASRSRGRDRRPKVEGPRGPRDRPTRRGRLARGVLLGVVLSVAGGGCNWLTGPRRPRRPKQGLLLRVNRHRATLVIGGVPSTLLDAHRENLVGLSPGTYRIAVQKAGYFTRYYDVVVRKGAFVRLDVRLPPEVE